MYTCKVISNEAETKTTANMSTEIYKTEFQARRAAKSFFAGILGISAKSVIVEHDRYNESRYGGNGTQCDCGQTVLHFFGMKNAGPRQATKLEKEIGRAGAVIALGECYYCGEKL